MKGCASLSCLIVGLCMVSAAVAAPRSVEIAFDRDAETLFQRALARYVQGNYEESREGFRELVETFPANQRTSAARLMLA